MDAFISPGIKSAFINVTDAGDSGLFVHSVRCLKNKGKFVDVMTYEKKKYTYQQKKSGKHRKMVLMVEEGWTVERKKN